MKISRFLTAISKKSRRIISIWILVILGFILPFSISIFSAKSSMGITATSIPELYEEKCFSVPRPDNKEGLALLKDYIFLSRSVYDRTRNPKCFTNTLKAAEYAINENNQIQNKSLQQMNGIEKELNILSLVIDMTQWLKETNDSSQYYDWMPERVKVNQGIQNELSNWVGKLQNQLKKLPEIQSWLQIKEPNLNSRLMYAQVNFAWNLSRIQELKEELKIKGLLLNFDASFWNKTGENFLNIPIQNSQKIGNTQEQIKAQIYALGYSGKWYQMKEKYDIALQQTKKALRLAEDIRAKDIYLWEWQLGQIYNEIYEAEYKKYSNNKNEDKNNNSAILRKAYQNSLVAYEEAYKSLQALRPDILAMKNKNKKYEEVPQWIFREKFEEPIYREYIDVILQKEEMELLLSPKQKDGTGYLNKEDLKKVRQVLDSLQIADLESYLQKPCPGFDSKLLDDILDKQDSKTAVIYPIFSDKRIAFIIKKSGDNKIYYKINKIGQKNLNLINRLKRNEIKISKSKIESIFRQMRYSLEQPYFSSEIGLPAAKAIYNWLIQPAENAKILIPGETKTLLFVSDGLLRNIPMAALYDEVNNKFLIEKYAIGLSPSLQASESSPNNNYKALVAGLSKDPRLSGFGILKNVEKEICTVRKIFDKSLAILNDKELVEAKKDCQIDEKKKPDIREKLSSSEYNIVHLATHGQFSYFNRDDSFVLTPSITPSTQDKDKKINLNEWEGIVKKRGFNSLELLTLSACETATGDDRDTLGISGISVRAGARSTLASLWSADDASTAKLMEKFYTELVKNKKSKAEALREAQISLLKDGYQPSHWSPFILVGDWR